MHLFDFALFRSLCLDQPLGASIVVVGEEGHWSHRDPTILKRRTPRKGKFNTVLTPCRIQALAVQALAVARLTIGTCCAVKKFDDQMMAKCHVSSYDSLMRLCSGNLKLFLAGSAGTMKRSIVKAMLDIDTNDCPYSDRYVE